LSRKLTITTKTPEQTRSLGRKLGEIVIPKDLICLYGNLGAGKTCFTQGIAHGLGIAQDEYVRSSTFVLLNEYKGGRIPLYHFDFFRIENEEEIFDTGFEEYVYHDGITVIEWADKFPEILPIEKLDIEFDITGLTERNILISLKCHDKRYDELFSSLQESIPS
jgi:tRNA threonylcarbamoyladenosine biosynthesis protein TsaE